MLRSSDRARPTGIPEAALTATAIREDQVRAREECIYEAGGDAMSDDEKKPVDLKQFEQRRQRRAMAAYDEALEQFTEATWRGLCALWERYADEAPKVPKVDGLVWLLGDPDAVFNELLLKLISLAQARGVDNKVIIECLCHSALTECEPEIRLEKLLDRATNLLMFGDEEASARFEEAMQ
jgi:hypothetical protein